ncbi:MAG: hypothetical protein U9N12_02355 [Euryarchaeota archaeon]|nr:hypothetical protein [Euryarchaeota archaeon]
MNNRSLILSAAVVAVGLFALPATVSMFAGQHSWYDPKDQGIPCEKCHWLEYEEMRSGKYTTHVPHTFKNSITGAIEYFECEECHNVTMNVGSYFKTGQVGEHTKAHAATTVSCLACHSDLFSNGTDACTTCHTGFGSFDGVNTMHVLAMKYGMGHKKQERECLKCHRDDDDTNNITAMRANVFINHVDEELSNPRAAHMPLFRAMQNSSDSQLSDANEACLGCHSRTGVNITWTRNSYVSYHVTCDNSGYNVSWNTSDNLGTNETAFGSTSGWD